MAKLVGIESKEIADALKKGLISAFKGFDAKVYYNKSKGYWVLWYRPKLSEEELQGKSVRDRSNVFVSEGLLNSYY